VTALAFQDAVLHAVSAEPTEVSYCHTQWCMVCSPSVVAVVCIASGIDRMDMCMPLYNVAVTGTVRCPGAQDMLRLLGEAVPEGRHAAAVCTRQLASGVPQQQGGACSLACRHS
jgi:hypothetical protein